MTDANISGAPKTKLLSISPYDDLGEASPREERGVFGVWTPGEDVSKPTHYGLFALQHYGQEAAGTAVGDGDQILVFEDLGLVSRVFNEQTPDTLKGHVVVGHTRYTTTGAPAWENAQPTLQIVSNGADTALGHNSDLTDHLTLFHEAVERGPVRDEGELPSDSAIMTTLFTDETGKIDHPEDYGCSTNVEATVMALLPRLKGAFYLTFIDGEALYVARDPYGVRPLHLGRLSDDWVTVSETCALDIAGASSVREIEPDEMMVIDTSDVRSQRFTETTHAGCIFEYVHLARPDSDIRGRFTDAVHLELGYQLVRELPADSDLVILVPESGTPVAVGYAQESGIPFGQGSTKNGYVGHTFIQSSQTIRQLGIRLRLNPPKEVIADERLVVVDDFIVRGNTQHALIRMLREAGMKEVYVRIAVSSVKRPCFYGIDFASPGESLTSGVDGSDIVADIAIVIGADSLRFVSIDGMVATSEQAKIGVCCVCFGDKYPLRLPEGNPNAVAVERMQTAQAARTVTSGQP